MSYFILDHTFLGLLLLIRHISLSNYHPFPPIHLHSLHFHLPPSLVCSKIHIDVFIFFFGFYILRQKFPQTVSHNTFW